MLRNANHLEDCLSALAAQLISAGLYDPSAVFISLDPEEPSVAPPGDNYVVLTPADFILDQGAVTGGGLDALFTNGSLTITFWFRTQRDEVARDVSALLHPAFGIIRRFRLGLTALQLYDPLDPSGNAILAEPTRIVQYTFRAPHPRPGWTRIVSTWQMNFTDILP